MDENAPMNCDELVEAVTDYLEGALAPEKVARLEEHLSVCQGCTSYLEQIRQTIRLTGRLSLDVIPPAGREALLGAFRRARAR